jgi:putative redox protein
VYHAAVREASTRAPDRATLPCMDSRPADVRSLDAPFAADIELGPHHLLADEPVDLGGGDAGPAPHDLLLAALGACTSMTVRMYARRKGWPLTNVHVHLRQEATDAEHRFFLVIELDGPLDDAQRARLLEIANKCPVHRTLTGKITIASDLAKAAIP